MLPTGKVMLAVPGTIGFNAKLMIGVVVPLTTVIWSAVPVTVVTVPSPLPAVTHALP